MKKFKVAIDDGHGMETAGKRTFAFPDGKVMKENEFNRMVGAYLFQELKRCGFDVIMVAPTDADTPLRQRTDEANRNGADAYVSIHANAYGAEWNKSQGVEVFHYPGSVEGKKLAECIHRNVIKGTKQIDRGVKTANFFVLRESKMPAALGEYAFMSNLEEAKLLLSDAFRKESAVETAMGICEYFGVKYIPIPTSQPQKPVQAEPKKEEVFKVQVGAYKDRKNAEQIVKELKEAGFDAIVKNQ